MPVSIEVRNESARRGMHRRDVLERIAARVLEGEGVAGAVELSVLFCDDPFIAELNRRYRKKKGPTDVLSFAQEDDMAVGGARALGDIVISLETVERFCDGEPARMRAEVRLLFCHGLLHLLGSDHADAAGKRRMLDLQARYLGVDANAAWHSERRPC
jgi:probable rRNA maturation factor